MCIVILYLVTTAAFCCTKYAQCIQIRWHIHVVLSHDILRNTTIVLHHTCVCNTQYLYQVCMYVQRIESAYIMYKLAYYGVLLVYCI